MSSAFLRNFLLQFGIVGWLIHTAVNATLTLGVIAALIYLVTA